MLNAPSLLRWVKLIGGFAFLHALAQGVNALSGIILVRSMSKEDYAWFTIFNSIAATITMLTDSGLGSAFASLGGA